MACAPTLAVALLALAAPSAAAPRDGGPGPLPWRVGGPLGFTVDAAAFPDSARQYDLEIYLRIPPATLAGLARVGDDPGRLRLSLRLRNSFGGRAQEAQQEFAIAPGDTGGGFGKVVVMHLPVKSGGYRLQARLEDPQSRKRGIAYMGRKVAQSAEVEGEIVVPAPQAGREISDIEFVWADAPQGSGAFGHGLPNPERLYGLLAGELRASFVARAPATEPRPWHWTARVLDEKGTTVAERDSVAPPAAVLAQTVSLDVSTVAAGGYDLEIKAWQEGDQGALLRRAHFSVAWRLPSWVRNPRDVEDDVHFLFEPDEEDRFAVMHPGEQESYLESYWRQRDPTPGTAENEIRVTYDQRVGHANHMWSRPGLGKGMFADMGRVYIRYGEPDEILKQVIPAGDQTLTRALRDLEISEDRPTGDVHSKGLGGDVRPFEVWIYDRDRAVPLLAPALGAQRPRKRLVFLFVDEQGYGDYTLRYTTE